MVIFYKIWKKCNEIQLTKTKMDLNKSKMRNIKAELELEPNFPGVATPQSSEWIISIISYTYNPLTGPWGALSNRHFFTFILNCSHFSALPRLYTPHSLCTTWSHPFHIFQIKTTSKKNFFSQDRQCTNDHQYQGQSTNSIFYLIQPDHNHGLHSLQSQ